MDQARIEALSQQQRQRLAKRLQELGAGSPVSERRLVAWVKGDQRAGDRVLKQYAQDHLQSAAVPQHFLTVTDFPRTATGKIDRRRLTAVALSISGPSPSSEASDGLERELLHVWRELFGREEISTDADFFEIGGDSLKLIQFIALAAQRGISITPSQVHSNPTIGSLARAMHQRIEARDLHERPVHQLAENGTNKITATAAEQQQDVSKEFNHAVVQGVTGGLIPLSAFSDKPYLFLIPPKARRIEEFWPLVSHMSQYTCFSPTVGEDVAGHRTVEDVALEFISQIKSQQPHGPYRLAGKCEGGHIAWVMAQKLVAAGEQVHFLGLIDTPNPDWLKPVSEGFWERWKRRVHTLRSRDGSLLLHLPARIYDWIVRRLKRAATGQRHLVRGGSRMSWLFSPESYAGHATLFHPTADLEKPDYDIEMAYGWGHLAQDGLDICFVPGNSLDFYIVPNVASFAKQFELAIQSRDVFNALQTESASKPTS